MITSSDLAEVRVALAHSVDKAVVLLAGLEARLLEEEEAFALWGEEEARRDAELEARREQFDRDADTVLDEAHRTGQACGIVRRKDGAA